MLVGGKKKKKKAGNSKMEISVPLGQIQRGEFGIGMPLEVNQNLKEQKDEFCGSGKDL